MGRPGYYLTDPSGLVTFPRAPRPGSGRYKWRDTDLIFPTEEGVIWTYPQERRRIWKPIFRVSETDLAIFETLHLSVDGITTPFYWVPDVADIGSAYLVRKEQGFNPNELERGVEGGEEQDFFDYTLELTEEISSSSISA